MIFGQTGEKLETSEDITTIESGVGDIGIIFQILSTLYNDPQRIIVQEYVANARDAHREIGKGNVPIEITLPTHLQSELKIRDFGPGISPDRMQNVFVLYGASTKRGNNLQTGGFGIGAKSVFCYTDSCAIETWVDGTYYNYSYMVGENKKPQCILMDHGPSEEPNGTRISINIAKNDIQTVCGNVYYVTQYWSTRPIIKNDKAYMGTQYKEYEEVISGTKWRFLKNRNNKTHCIIDEIPYKFDFDAVFKDSSDRSRYQSVFNSGNFDFILNTGDVTMSPNREGPVYDVESRKVFRKIVETAVEEIKNKLIDQMKTIDNIFDALEASKVNMMYRDLVGTLTWRGFSLGDRIQIKGDFYTTYHIWKGGRKTKINQCYDISIERHNKYYINNDQSPIPPAKIKTVLLSHASAYVIVPVQYDERVHAKYLTEDGFNEARNEYAKNLNLEAFKLEDFTLVEKFKAPRQAKSEKVNIYLFNPSNLNKSVINWDRMNADFDELTGYFVEYDRGTPVGYSLAQLKELKDTFKIDIYGVPSKYIKVAHKSDELDHVSEYIKDQLAEMKQYITDNNDIIYAKQVLGYSHTSHGTIKRLSSDMVKMLKESDIGREYYSASERVIADAQRPYVSNVMDKYNTLAQLSQTANEANIIPTVNIEELASNMIAEFPLLSIMDSFGVTIKQKEHLIHYLEYLILVKPSLPAKVDADPNDELPF